MKFHCYLSVWHLNMQGQEKAGRAERRRVEVTLLLAVVCSQGSQSTGLILAWMLAANSAWISEGGSQLAFQGSTAREREGEENLDPSIREMSTLIKKCLG